MRRRGRSLLRAFVAVAAHGETAHAAAPVLAVSGS
jgi:hypothetical protein